MGCETCNRIRRMLGGVGTCRGCASVEDLGPLPDAEPIIRAVPSALAKLRPAVDIARETVRDAMASVWHMRYLPEEAAETLAGVIADVIERSRAEGAGQAAAQREPLVRLAEKWRLITDGDMSGHCFDNIEGQDLAYARCASELCEAIGAPGAARES